VGVADHLAVVDRGAGAAVGHTFCDPYPDGVFTVGQFAVDDCEEIVVVATAVDRAGPFDFCPGSRTSERVVPGAFEVQACAWYPDLESGDGR
jgi:hypothetical protein